LHGPSGTRRGSDLNKLGIIQDGAVLIVDGVIREVGLSRRVENVILARDAKEIDATGRVVMPGFVDSHTHLVGPSAAASARTLENRALRVLDDAVRHGTTALEAKAGDTKILKGLERQPISIVRTFLCTKSGVEYQERRDQYLAWVCSYLLPLIKRRKLAEFADIRCEKGGFDEADARQYLSAARQLGFGLKIQTGPGPSAGVIRVAAEMGATSIDCGVEAGPDEAAILAQSATMAMLLPGEVFYRGTDRYPPARMLAASGVAMALSTNYNPETSPCQNMQMMLTLACQKMNLTPAEAITLATLNAAHALRRASRAGSLENGKSGDLLILDVPDYREIPNHFGMNLVDLVMKNGEVLVERTEVKWPAL
jgi:imidazolonepropionase